MSKYGITVMVDRRKLWKCSFLIIMLVSCFIFSSSAILLDPYNLTGDQIATILKTGTPIKPVPSSIVTSYQEYGWVEGYPTITSGYVQSLSSSYNGQQIDLTFYFNIPKVAGIDLDFYIGGEYTYKASSSSTAQSYYSRIYISNLTATVNDGNTDIPIDVTLKDSNIRVFGNATFPSTNQFYGTYYNNAYEYNLSDSFYSGNLYSITISFTPTWELDDDDYSNPRMLLGFGSSSSVGVADGVDITTIQNSILNIENFLTQSNQDGGMNLPDYFDAILTIDEAEQIAVDAVTSELNNAADRLDQTGESLDIVKPNIDELLPNISDINPDFNQEQVSSIFESFFNNSMILNMLIIVISFALVGYILYGRI